MSLLLRSQLQAAPRPRVNELALAWATLVLGSGFGVGVAYLIVAGYWPIALGLIAAVPTFVLLHRHPFASLLIWLVLAQFLMTTETVMLRRIYWVIHRALPPAMVGLIVLSSLLRIQPRKLPKLGLPELAMAGYLGISLVSILYLSHTARATTYLFYDSVFVPFCLYLVVRLSAPDERELKRLLPVVFFVCAAQLAIGILAWTVPSVLPRMWTTDHIATRTIGSLVNPSTYTVALAFCSLLLLHGAQSQKAGPQRTLYAAMFVLANVGILITFTRSSWLAGAVMMLGLVYLYPKFMVRSLLVAALIFISSGGVLLTEPMSRAQERLYSAAAEESALSRLPVYFAAYRMFQAKPFFGWGYDNFDLYDREFQGRVGDLVNAEKDHASHNRYLTLVAEQGLAGLMLFFAPVIWLLLLTVKRLPSMPKEGLGSRKLLIIFWLFILCFFIVNNFFNMYVVYGLGLWWIALAFIANIVHTDVDQSRPFQKIKYTGWP